MLGRARNVEGEMTTAPPVNKALTYFYTNSLIGKENGSKILFTGGVTVLSSSDPAVSQLHGRTDPGELTSMVA